MGRLASRTTLVCAAALVLGCTANPGSGVHARAEGTAGDPTGGGDSGAPLGTIATSDGQFIQFFEATGAPGLVYVNEMAPNGMPSMITPDLMQLDALELWSRLSPDRAPDALVAAFERSNELVDDPAEPLAAAPGEPTSAGDTMLRTQAEVNWFVSTFCVFNPEHCLLYNLWAQSISPPTKWWDAAAAHAYESPYFWNVVVETYYWGPIPNNYGLWQWYSLGPYLYIPPNWWSSRHVPQQKKNWQFKAYAYAAVESPELIGLRAAWGQAQPPPPPPPVEPCTVSIEIHTTTCYNVQGGTFEPNFSAWGCGDTVPKAMQRAKNNLSKQVCLIESQMEGSGCCEYMFDDALAGCICN